jgi:hypothetical protein
VIAWERETATAEGYRRRPPSAGRAIAQAAAGGKPLHPLWRAYASQRAARGDPAVVECDDLGGNIKVSVIMHERRSVLASQYCGQQISDPYSAVSACSG